jgi:hypothetical protein
LTTTVSFTAPTLPTSLFASVSAPPGGTDYVTIPFAVNVVALDSTSHTATSYNGPVSLSVQSGPSGGGFASGTLSTNFSSGGATFSNLKMNKAGIYVLKIISGNLSTTVTINAGRLT